MKGSITLISLLLVSITGIAQTAFDNALSEISTSIAGKLKTLNKKRVVVLYITDINKTVTAAGKYMADAISVNFVNDPGTFSVFDRNNLDEMKESKDLMKEGYFVDSNRAAELGRSLNVDVIVVGNYTVLSKTIKLTLKALNAVNGFVIAASMKDLPLDADAGTLLGINVGSESNGTSNRGFNHPLSSNENINDPQTVDKSCETKNTGDYCFTNTTKYNTRVDINVSDQNAVVLYRNEITISPGQTQCFYQVPAMVAKYFIFFSDPNAPYGGSAYPRNVPGILQGDVLIEKCKSKTFTIK